MSAPAAEGREHLKLAYPTEFKDGAKRAFKGDHIYPPGFASWPLKQRNAWFSGFNLGYCDRSRLDRNSNG
jgi:hypothetical protein